MREENANASLERIRSEVEGTLLRLRDEITTMYGSIVAPRWETEPHRYPRTLFGYVMNCFSLIDMLAYLWLGRSGNQTVRMVRFMNRFFGTGRQVNAVTVQVWRHALMHFGEPLVVTDEDSGATYHWLIHWSEDHLPAEQNLTIVQRRTTEFVLNVGLYSFVTHLQHAAWAFFNEAQSDVSLGNSVISRWIASRNPTANLSDPRFDHV